MLITLTFLLQRWSETRLTLIKTRLAPFLSAGPFLNIICVILEEETTSWALRTKTGSGFYLEKGTVGLKKKKTQDD